MSEESTTVNINVPARTDENFRPRDLAGSYSLTNMSFIAVRLCAIDVPVARCESSVSWVRASIHQVSKSDNLYPASKACTTDAAVV